MSARRRGPDYRALVSRVLPVFDGQLASGDFVARQRDVARGIHSGRLGDFLDDDPADVAGARLGHQITQAFGQKKQDGAVKITLKP